MTTNGAGDDGFLANLSDPTYDVTEGVAPPAHMHGQSHGNVRRFEHAAVAAFAGCDRRDTGATDTTTPSTPPETTPSVTTPPVTPLPDSTPPATPTPTMPPATDTPAPMPPASAASQ